MRLNRQADDLKGKLDRALEAERRVRLDAENADREKKKLTVAVGSLESQLSSSRAEATTLGGKSHDLELKLNGTLDQWRIVEEKAKGLERKLKDSAEETNRLEKLKAALDAQLREKEAIAARVQMSALEFAQLSCDFLGLDPYDSQLPNDLKEVIEDAEWLGRDKRRSLQVAGACRKAFEGASEAVKRQRYEYQLGRALLAAGDAQGLEYLKGAADGQYRAAITLLAFSYREGVKGVISADYNKARELYTHAIGLNDPTAMVQRARMHEVQKFKELNLAEARRLLEMAAKLEFGPALATRGDILSDEKKAKAYGFAGKDCDRAVKDLRDAGTKGIAAAVKRLAELASKGC